MTATDDNSPKPGDESWGKILDAGRRDETVAVFLQKTFETIPYGLAAFDKDYRLAFWNDRYIELMDYPAGLATRGTHFREFLAHNARAGEYGVGDIEEQVRVRMLPEHLLDERNFEWPRLNGRILRLRRSPVPGGGLLVVISDITDTKRQELRQRQSELRLQLLSNNVEEGLLIHDGSTVFDANEAALRIFGWSLGEMVGKPLYAICAPDSWSVVETVLESDEENPVEVSGERSDGTRFPLEVISRTIPPSYVDVYEPLVLQPGGTLAKLSDLPSAAQSGTHSHILMPDGRLLMLTPAEREVELAKQSGRMLLLRELTERKAAEEDRQRVEQHLRQAQKLEAMGTLAGGIAHDFNNILSAVLGYAELITETHPADSRASEYSERIITAGNRAKELVNQMLVFSRRTPSERQMVDLGAVVEETLLLIRASLPATIEIRTDPTQIHQVVMNLCANAHHAMADGGSLDITLDEVEIEQELSHRGSQIEPGRYARLAIVDTGYGISSSDMDCIFDPFFTTKEVGVGTGLGLSIVHGIVTGHGGAVHVYSESGLGTTFHVYIPCVDDGQTEVRPDTVSRPRGNGEAILIVDDEEPLLDLTEEMLEQLGYVAFGVGSGDSALEIIRKSPRRFDLVLTDLTMHGMTGIALAEEIRRLEPRLPIILVTGYSNREVSGNAKSAGIQEILSKPLLLDELAGSVARVLATR
jgi:PAS domain S-box-containing protein